MFSIFLCISFDHTQHEVAELLQAVSKRDRAIARFAALEILNECCFKLYLAQPTASRERVDKLLVKHVNIFRKFGVCFRSKAIQIAAVFMEDDRLGPHLREHEQARLLSKQATTQVGTNTNSEESSVQIFEPDAIISSASSLGNQDLSSVVSTVGTGVWTNKPINSQLRFLSFFLLIL